MEYPALVDVSSARREEGSQLWVLDCRDLTGAEERGLNEGEVCLVRGIVGEGVMKMKVCHKT